METMKKSTLTIFCILAGCIFFLSGIWIYFQKNLDRVELGEGERATAYQRHYLMIANDKDTGMWQSVYESASKEAESKDAYVELLSPEQMNGYSQADCLKIGIASKVDGIILEADGSKEEQHLITEALKDGIPVVTVMTDDTATSRISFVGLNSYQMGSAYTEQIQGMLKDKGSTSVMFLSTSSSKTQETNLVYSQVKKELESRKKPGQTVDLTEDEHTCKCCDKWRNTFVTDPITLPYTYQKTNYQTDKDCQVWVHAFVADQNSCKTTNQTDNSAYRKVDVTTC